MKRASGMEWTPQQGEQKIIPFFGYIIPGELVGRIFQLLTAKDLVNLSEVTTALKIHVSITCDWETLTKNEDLYVQKPEELSWLAFYKRVDYMNDFVVRSWVKQPRWLKYERLNLNYWCNNIKRRAQCSVKVDISKTKVLHLKKYLVNQGIASSIDKIRIYRYMKTCSDDQLVDSQFIDKRSLTALECILK